jgi:phosphoheptose isomerase
MRRIVRKECWLQMNKLTKLIKDARFVWVCGNGGSHANAEHFANDLFSRGIKAICLGSNNSIMTMIANDFGYGQTYSEQLEVYGDPEDLLITLSCSGTSVNVVNAIAKAEEIGMKTYQFDPFKYGEKDYEKLENEHLILAHSIKKEI